MENKILNELAGYISDMSAKLTQIQKCINVLANARNETVPSTTDAESDPDKSGSSIYDWDSEMIRIAKTPNSNGYIYNLLFLTMLEDNLKRGANPDGLKEFYRKNMEDSSWVEEFIDKWVTLHAHKNTESPLDTNSTEDSECEKCTEDDGDFEAFMADIFGIPSELIKKNPVSNEREEHVESDTKEDKAPSDEFPNKWMYEDLCVKFPLLRMASFSNAMIARIYEFFRYFEVDSVPVCTCHTEDKDRKFVFRACTSQFSNICMCVDFGSDTSSNDGIRINITLTARNRIYDSINFDQWINDSFIIAVRDMVFEEVRKINHDTHDVGDIGFIVDKALEKYTMTPISENDWKIDNDHFGISYSLIFKLFDNCGYDISVFLTELHSVVSITLNYFMQLVDTIDDAERGYIKDVSKDYRENVEKCAMKFRDDSVKKKCTAHKCKRTMR